MEPPGRRDQERVERFKGVSLAAARGMTIDELKATGAVASPMNRWAEADEVAYPILWLASSEASFITGVALPVDGAFR